MRIEFHESAAEDERYASHAFDRCIGQDAPFKIGGVEHGRVTVVAVKVDEDGRGATWTVDIPDDAAGNYRVGPISGFTGGQSASFAFREDPEIPGRWWDLRPDGEPGAGDPGGAHGEEDGGDGQARQHEGGRS